MKTCKTYNSLKYVQNTFQPLIGTLNTSAQFLNVHTFDWDHTQTGYTARTDLEV